MCNTIVTMLARRSNVVLVAVAICSFKIWHPVKLPWQMSSKAYKIGHAAIIHLIAFGGAHLHADSFTERVRVVEAVGASVRVRLAPSRGSSQ